MGRLHKRRKPNFKRGDLVRVNRGELVGMYARVTRVMKNRVWIETRNAYHPWHDFRIYASFSRIKPSALTKVHINEVSGIRPFTRLEL